MKRTNYFSIGTIAGSFCYGAISSLRQDSLGQEGYIAEVRAHWLPEQLTVPLALAMLAVVLGLTVYAGFSSANDEYSERKSRY